MKQVFSYLAGLMIGLCAPGAYAGTPPTAALSMSPWVMGETIDFGDVAVGATSTPPQVTTLTAFTTNGGIAHIDSIVVNGSTDFDLTLGGANCGPGTDLANMAQCAFPVVFSPASTGTHTGTIRVTCQVFGAITAATVLCNGVEQTIVSLLGSGFTVSQIPTLGQWGVTLLGLTVFGLALLQLRRRA